MLNGFELLRQLRKRSAIPVIMLTARTEQSDRIAALDAGADDYIPKSFGREEILPRIRAMLRRAGNPELCQLQIFEAGGLRLNLQKREVWNDCAPVEVTSIELDILDLLVRAAGLAVSRDELTAVLYQRCATPFARSIDVHISHLLKKLESQDHALILTIRGVGYLFSPGSGSEQ